MLFSALSQAVCLPPLCHRPITGMAMTTAKKVFSSSLGGLFWRYSKSAMPIIFNEGEQTLKKLVCTVVTTHLWPDYDSAYRPTLTRFFTVLLGSVEPVPCFTGEKMSRAINIPIFTSLPLAVGGWRCLSCQLGRWGECLHRGVVATEKGRVVSLTVLPNPCTNSREIQERWMAKAGEMPAHLNWKWFENLLLNLLSCSPPLSCMWIPNDL